MTLIVKRPATPALVLGIELNRIVSSPHWLQLRSGMIFQELTYRIWKLLARIIHHAQKMMRPSWYFTPTQGDPSLE